MRRLIIFLIVSMAISSSGVSSTPYEEEWFKYLTTADSGPNWISINPDYKFRKFLAQEPAMAFDMSHRILKAQLPDARESAIRTMVESNLSRSLWVFTHSKAADQEVFLYHFRSIENGHLTSEILHSVEPFMFSSNLDVQIQIAMLLKEYEQKLRIEVANNQGLASLLARVQKDVDRVFTSGAVGSGDRSPRKYAARAILGRPHSESFPIYQKLIRSREYDSWYTALLYGISNQSIRDDEKAFVFATETANCIVSGECLKIADREYKETFVRTFVESALGRLKSDSAFGRVLIRHLKSQKVFDWEIGNYYRNQDKAAYAQWLIPKIALSRVFCNARLSSDVAELQRMLNLDSKE